MREAAVVFTGRRDIVSEASAKNKLEMIPRHKPHTQKNLVL